MKTFASAVAVALLMGTAGAAHAAQCTTKFLTGLWVGAADEEDPAYCVVQFKENGWISQASCFDPPVLKSIVTWKGRFTVTKNCSVTGDFDGIQKGGRKLNFKYSGTMNPKRGTIGGTLTPRNGPSATYGFVQQWN
jgi:hypothetical protein